MPEDEKIVKQTIEIKASDKERPGIVLGSGTLLLTNRRLVYLKSRMGLTRYETVEDFEEDLGKKGSFEIPLSAITEAESDRRLMAPYFKVNYRTEEGPRLRSFWPEGGGTMEEMTAWVEAVFQGMKDIRGEGAGEKAEGRRRSLFIVDQSHDQDDRATSKIADVVNEICERLQLAEPFAIQGRPRDELLMDNQHLFPRAVVFMSIGTKSGDKFSERERELIDEYVRNGGRLLLAAFPPEKPPNDVLEPLGVRFGENPIEDEKHHAGRHKDHIIVEDLADHPINDGVKTIRFGKFGCYPLEIENPEVEVLAFSSGDSDPPRAPVAALVPHGAGMALVIGQTRLFQDDTVDEFDNARWFENIVTFMAAEQLTEVVTEAKEKIAEAETLKKFHCTSCGAKLSEGDLFCGSCGQKVSGLFDA